MPDNIEMRFRPCGAVKALPDRKLKVLALPFGSPTDLDKMNEYFTARTEFMLEVGDKRPVLYFHGFTPNRGMEAKPTPIGKAIVAEQDDQGVWMIAELTPRTKAGHEQADRIWKAAEAGTCRASTGAINYLCRSADDGEVEVWPVGELSLIDEGLGRHPVNDKAVAMPLRASFKAVDLEWPEEFEAGEDKAPHGYQVAQPEPTFSEGVTTMDEKQEAPVEAQPVVDVKAIAAEVKASVVDELKKEPKYKAMFNIAKETVGEPADNDKKESWEWFWHMRHGNTTGPSMRVLHETTAAEGLPLVPQDALNQIVSLRNETSLASRAGLKRYQTDKLIFNIPREVTAMTALAAIAEEGAYVAQEPVFGLLAYTMQKYGKMVTATEELLEDQNLFIPWFTSACGRAWALAENAAMYTEADLIGSSTIGVAAGSDTLTLAEWNEFFWTMTTPYRDDCVLVMNTASMAILHALQVATAYAFGNYPDVNRNPLGLPSVNGIPVHLCNDWPAYNAAAAAHVVLSMANREYCGIIERRGMTIKVDPYGTAATGTIRYFPSVRFHGFFAQPLAHVVKEGN